MKVTKEMYHKDLQSQYPMLKFTTPLLGNKLGIRLSNLMMSSSKGKNIEGLRCEEKYIPSNNGGPDIRVRIFRPNTNDVLPGMLYNHGGGYLSGYPESYLHEIEQFIKKRPCVVVAPDYRKSIRNPYPAGFNDCYDTLLWMRDNTSELNIRSDKFIVAGHSAGGGLTAAVTLKACDTKDVNIAFQMPCYPMIDHRQLTESAREMGQGVPIWNAKNNAFGWKMYLQNFQEGQEIPVYASPALNEDNSHLPPTISFVADLEPFKDETINYINSLKSSGVPVKFELFKGGFHMFENVVKEAEISIRANEFQYNAFAEYYDTYL